MSESTMTVEQVVSKLTLALIDPEYEGLCPCAHGTIYGIAVDVGCWRTNGGCGVTVDIGLGMGAYTKQWEATGGQLGAFVASLVRTGWPSMHVHITYADGDSETLGGCSDD